MDDDLGQKLIDRRIGLADDPSTPAVETTGSRHAPSLRFFLDSSGTTMWNPAVETACGTPWVRLPSDEAAAGGSVDAAFLGVEPTVILEQRPGYAQGPRFGRDPDRVRGRRAGDRGRPRTCADGQPAVAAALAEETTPATVAVTRDGTQLTLTVDITNALARLNSQVAGAKSAVSWHLGPLDSTIAGPGEVKIADSTCTD